MQIEWRGTSKVKLTDPCEMVLLPAVGGILMAMLAASFLSTNISIGSRRGSDACYCRMPTGRDGRSDEEGHRSSSGERSYWD